MVNLSNQQRWALIVALGVAVGAGVWLFTGEGGLAPVGDGGRVSVDPSIPPAPVE